MLRIWRSVRLVFLFPEKEKQVDSQGGEQDEPPEIAQLSRGQFHKSKHPWEEDAEQQHQRHAREQSKVAKNPRRRDGGLWGNVSHGGVWGSPLWRSLKSGRRIARTRELTRGVAEGGRDGREGV